MLRSETTPLQYDGHTPSLVGSPRLRRFSGGSELLGDTGRLLDDRPFSATMRCKRELSARSDVISN